MYKHEQYRIQPTTHYDDDDKTFFGDGVVTFFELDEQGTIIKERARFGRVVRGWPNLRGSPDKLRIELFNNSDYKTVKAPPNWRDLIVEDLTGA